MLTFEFAPSFLGLQQLQLPVGASVLCLGFGGLVDLLRFWVWVFWCFGARFAAFWTFRLCVGLV